MLKIEVDAFDCRHPEHEAMMALVDDKGLDIELLPTFTVEIDVPNTGEALLSPWSPQAQAVF